MIPYQSAAEKIGQQGETPLKLAKGAIGLAGTAATAYYGGGVVNRVLPFLSKYIPENLAIKGLSKIDPRYGKFIEKALSAGKSIEEVKDFIGEKIQESEPAKESRSIIEQESPELHKFIDQEIRKGRKPVEAAAIAQNDKKFMGIIKKLMKSHKTPWSSIVESVFGSGEMALPTQQQPVQQQQQQQTGQGAQAMMAILQKINQRLGR